ncbi:hypothetical protein L810_5424 [Burkholderia sp. AU4i]|nr:hypothetical protein L810_5424 [Burkholderia sp. AU4i]
MQLAAQLHCPGDRRRPFQMRLFHLTLRFRFDNTKLTGVN